ncbi:MAG TPA: DUF3054 domain-containing protein [Micropruina sp.]|nr:DUF3054 domain-containing protein [Micropruina sp.]
MKWWTALCFDLVVVLAFATIGRLSHGEAADPGGIVNTAWPFVVALIGTTGILIGLQRPTELVTNGALVWVGTLVFGMWIRARSGDGVQVSFVIVAGVFLVLCMLGWRLLAARRAHAAR